MQKEGGVYRIPCEVNGLRLKFIFDTGASNVAISLSEAYLMLDNGYLNKNDIVGTSHSKIADGTIVENTQIILRELKIGGIILKDVEAVVIKELQAPLLLGQSAIQKLGKIQIEGDELIIMNIKNEYSQKEIDEMFDSAKKYYESEMYVAAAEFLQKLYDLDLLNDYGIFHLAVCYFKSGKYEDALKYNLLLENNEDFKSYETIALCYKLLKNYDKSILYLQKSFPYIDKIDVTSLHSYYSSMSDNYIALNDCYQYREYSELEIKYLIEKHNTTISQIIRYGFANKEIMNSFFLIGYNLVKDCNLTDLGKYYLSIAARCGHDASIKYCDSYKIDYNNIKIR